MGRQVKRGMRGFTLVELLVALAITALIMVIAYGGLNSVRKQSEAGETSMKRLRQVQLAMDVMSRDFQQLEPRPVRDGLGGTVPALLAGPDNVPPIQFTRGGWSNPLGTPRSTQQRVAYSLEDGKLVRAWWPELDGQVQVQPAKEPLLDDVESMHLQYMDAVSKNFQDVWAPPSQTLAGQPQNPLPIAVSITVTLKDLGEVTRIVEVACDASCNPKAPAARHRADHRAGGGGHRRRPGGRHALAQLPRHAPHRDPGAGRSGDGICARRRSLGGTDPGALGGA